MWCHLFEVLRKPEDKCPLSQPHLQSTPSHTWPEVFRKRRLPALKQPKCTAHSALEAQSGSKALGTTRPICFCAPLTPSRTTEANGDRKLETSGTHRFQLICTADLQNSDNPEVSRRHLTATFNIYSSFALFSHFKRNLIAKAEMKGSWNSLSRLDRTDSKAKGELDYKKDVPLQGMLMGQERGDWTLSLATPHSQPSRHTGMLGASRE